ncbi:phosphodiesterase DibA [Pseudomonas sp. dw_358]|uniref:phosphodiesterase DibA n=1 Tax=Pseudomonas sp. dw_358 TaxID=2720083 RepID=UPI001BD49DBC|nr:EAL domain-containing protein [Pseudomonas sp. dw_358]
MPVFNRSGLRAAVSYVAASLAWSWAVTHLYPSGVPPYCPALWVLASAGLLYHCRNRQLSAAGVSPDLTRLRLATAVYDNTLEGVLVTDRQGRIVHVNPAFIDITGYSIEQVLGQNPNTFKSGHHPAEFYRQMFDTLAQKDKWSGEIWNRRKSGEVYPQWQTIQVIRDDQGELSHYVAVFSDISAIRRSEQELTRLAHHDPLTGLPNRLLFSALAEQALSSARTARQGCALLMIDLDWFQQVNDGFGHATGDLLLKTVVRRLQNLCAPGLTLARLGGDEFALLAEDCFTLNQATSLAQRIMGVLKPAFQVQGHTLLIGASVGISLFPHDADNAEQLLRNADSALFKAKGKGRGGYALYTEELTAHAQQRVEITAQLRDALEQNQLRVYYQPVHDLASGRLVGAEALVRWQHPLRGLVPPAEFIPIAEQSGLIAEIDAWVMTQACWQMVAWQQAGQSLDFIAVNVSSRLFGQSTLFAQVAAVLSATGLEPALLELEVTESAVMNEPDAALEQMHRLRELGIRLAIDDFGTGYSSLLRLKRLPVHKLKIDQGFVAGLPGDDDDVAITLAIIALARSMGLQVHAEGIEEEAQARFLHRHGCELGQGYWYGRPAPLLNVAINSVLPGTVQPKAKIPVI